MKWLGRILLHAVTVLSLLLCVSTVGLWINSYLSPWQAWFGKGQVYFIRSAAGSLFIQPVCFISGQAFVGAETVMPEIPYASIFLASLLLPTCLLIRRWISRKLGRSGFCGA